VWPRLWFQVVCCDRCTIYSQFKRSTTTEYPSLYSVMFGHLINSHYALLSFQHKLDISGISTTHPILEANSIENGACYSPCVRYLLRNVALTQTLLF
jgi:hypothetical protein